MGKLDTKMLPADTGMWHPDNMSQDVTRLCHETGLSVTHALLQRFSPADRAGLDKMDYVWTVNGKEVDNEQVLLCPFN